MPSTRAVDPSISKTPLPMDAENLATVCVLCSHNCGLRVDVADGKIVEIRADESSPITKGYICNKGFAIGHYVEHAQRVEHPLKRRGDGTFERITWEQAITRDRRPALRRFATQHSPRVDRPRRHRRPGKPHGRARTASRFLSALGSKRWFNAFAQEKTQHFLVAQWMFDAPPSVFFHPDIEHTHFLLMHGNQPEDLQPRTQRHRHVQGARRQPESEARRPRPARHRDDAHRRSPPQGQARLRRLRACSAWPPRIVSSEGLVDARFIEQRTHGFETLRKALAAVDIDEMARRAGIATADLVSWRASTPRPSRPRSCSTWRSSTISSRRSRRI